MYFIKFVKFSAIILSNDFWFFCLLNLNLNPLIETFNLVIVYFSDPEFLFGLLFIISFSLLIISFCLYIFFPDWLESFVLLLFEHMEGYYLCSKSTVGAFLGTVLVYSVPLNGSYFCFFVCLWSLLKIEYLRKEPPLPVFADRLCAR